MAIQIKLRRDQSSIWDSDNPVLLAGEMAFQYDSGTSQVGRFKIGNGHREWSRLPYFYAYQDSAGNYPSSGGGNSFTWGGTRALPAGGYVSNSTNTIDYFDITSPGNASDFGDLSRSTRQFAALSDATYAIFAGGISNTATVDIMDYVTSATPGNASDFGDMTAAIRGHMAVSNGTRGVFGGGYSGSSGVDTIEYITLGTTSGNGTDFGDLTVARYEGCTGGINDSTRGVFPNSTGSNNVFDYITFATPGNATDFGDHSGDLKSKQSAASDTTRGLIGGGYLSSNQIHYITTQTPGNTIDFGDLSRSADQMGATSDGTYCVWVGGRGPTTPTAQIDYVTIQTPGNATDFGDLNVARRLLDATSGNAA